MTKGNEKLALLNYKTYDVSIINEEHTEDFLNTSFDSTNSSASRKSSLSTKKTCERHSKPIDGSSISKIVGSNPDIQDFDNTVEIIDSVVMDHISEDDKSIISDEVTYERWTEETKLTKTHVLDKNGNIVEEIYQNKSQPELVGNILREKLIERHENIKHVSQDVLKRIKVKPISNSHNDDSNVLIIKPTSSVALQLQNRREKNNNSYYIQHQQIISPIEGTVIFKNNPRTINSVLAMRQSNSSASSNTSDKFNESKLYTKKRPALPNYHLTPLMNCSKSTCLSKLLEQEESYSKIGGSDKCDEINPDLPIAEIVDDTNKRYIVQNHFRVADKNIASSFSEESFINNTDDLTSRGLIESCLSTNPSLLNTKNTTNLEITNETNQLLSDYSLSSTATTKNFAFKNKDESSNQYRPMSQKATLASQAEVIENDQDRTTSDSLESMGRFKRPTKVEMKKLSFQTVKSETAAEYKVENDMIEYDDGTEEYSNFEPHRINNNIKYFMASSSQATSSPVNNITFARKSLDMTDISDTEDVFNRTNNQSETSFSTDNYKQRRTPLRRESFEMAQKSDSMAKRLSLTTSLKQKRLEKQQESSSSLSTSTDSSNNQQHSTQDFSSLHEIKTGQNMVNPSRRLISEIKPLSSDEKLNQTNTESNIDECLSNQNTDEFFKTKMVIENKIKLVDTSNDNESDSSTDSGLLKRNLELLRKKSSGKNQTEDEVVDNNTFIATTYIKPTMSDEVLPKAGSKIKFVKKSTSNKRSEGVSETASIKTNVRPQLVRGPDIIETIETTTSMSFIMNKNIKLIYEEKRIPPQVVKENFVNSGESCSLKKSNDYETIWDYTKNSTPIPITIQTRSRSEPRLIDSSPFDLNSSSDGHIINYPPIASSPKNTKNKSFQRYNNVDLDSHISDIMSPNTLKSKKYDQIAYTSNLCQQSANFSKSEPNLFEESPNNYGLNKHLKMDSWNKWPEYAVEQDTDSSVHSTQDFNYQWIKNDKKSDNVYKLDVEIERRMRPDEFKKDINQNYHNHHHCQCRQPYHHHSQKVMISTLNDDDFTMKSHSTINNALASVSATTASCGVQNIEQQSAATRMSSGYFSGDDFRSFHSQQMYNPFLSLQSGNHNTFNVNKFINGAEQTKKHKFDALDDLNNMYKNIVLEDDNHQMNETDINDYKLYNQVNIHINKELEDNKVYELIEDINPENNHQNKSIYSCRSVVPDYVKDDMAARRIGPNYEDIKSMRRKTINKSAFNLNQDFFTGLASNENDSFDIKRQRSNSLSNLKTDNGLYMNNIAVPSPTTADYLRNRTRENFNVIMNPCKSLGQNIHTLPCENFQLSQILYDDMAYRQLRKDSDAYKLSQMKSMSNNYKNAINSATTPLTNITTLPLNYINQHEQISNTNVKTVKMIKQRDACNKTYKQQSSTNNVNNATMCTSNR